MEKFNRAVRRHHVERLKQKRKSYWGYNRSWGREGIQAMSPQQLGRIVQYPQACSCMGCGNQRKYEGRPLNERCDIIMLKEELDDAARCAGHSAWQDNANDDICGN